MPPKSAKDRRALAKKKAKEGTKEAETQNGATEQTTQQTGKAVEKPKAESKTESKKPVEKKDDAVSLKEKGNLAFEKQDYPRALELYTKAIEADAKNHSLYSNRSAAFAAMRNFTKALDDADKCVELKAQWPKGHYRRGHALEGLLRYPEAYQAYQTGLALDANDANLKKAAAELKVLLDELKITEKELADKKTGDNPDNDKFETMVKWLRDGGAKFPKLYLQYYSEDYRGVHALTKIPNDDVILYVPLQLIMTSEVAKASEICKKIIQAGVDLRSTHSYLAACLLQEKAKGPKSQWYPYINILPEKYANMPIFFDEEQLAWIQNSFTLQKIADRIDSLRREYEAIRRAVPEFAKFSLNEFIWGRLAVITRIFGLVVDGNKTDGLVPYADMLNHKRPNEPGGGKDQCDTKWTYDDGRKGFIITMVRTIQRGDQVYDSYGRKCNSRFFVNYGFTLEDNEDNEVVIRLQMPSNDPHFMMKLRFLGGKADHAKREFQVPGFYKEKKCHELFSFLRFINAQDAEILPFSTSEAKLEDVEPISIKNEIKCLEQLHKAAKEVYDRFKETLEDDTKLLASGKLEMYSNNRNCVVMRHGEKVVLRQLMSLAEEGIPLLKSNYATVKKLAGKAQAGATTLDQYITQVIVPLVKKGA